MNLQMPSVAGTNFDRLRGSSFTAKTLARARKFQMTIPRTIAVANNWSRRAGENFGFAGLVSSAADIYSFSTFGFGVLPALTL